jgi:hypothetical protein
MRNEEVNSKGTVFGSSGDVIERPKKKGKKRRTKTCRRKQAKDNKKGTL